MKMFEIFENLYNIFIPLNYEVFFIKYSLLS